MTSEDDQDNPRKRQRTLSRKILGSLPQRRDDDRTL